MHKLFCLGFVVIALAISFAFVFVTQRSVLFIVLTWLIAFGVVSYINIDLGWLSDFGLVILKFYALICFFHWGVVSSLS